MICCIMFCSKISDDVSARNKCYFQVWNKRWEYIM